MKLKCFLLSLSLILSCTFTACEQKNTPHKVTGIYFDTVVELTVYGKKVPEEALELPWEFVSPAEADQRIAAEYVWAYPPGIPLLVPGQKICADVFSLDTDGPELHSTRGQLPERIAVLR